MEAGLILRVIIQRKVPFALLAMEVAAGLLVVVFLLQLGEWARRRDVFAEGLDDQVLAISSERLFSQVEVPTPDDAQHALEALEELEALQTLPGVAVAAAIERIPVRELEYPSQVALPGRRAPPQAAWVVEGSPALVEVLGLELVAGRLPNPTAGTAGEVEVLISQPLAQTLHPSGSVLGMSLKSSTQMGVGKIVGILKNMPVVGLAMMSQSSVLYPMPGADPDHRTYLARTAPGRASALAPELEQALRRHNPQRAFQVQTFGAVRNDYLRFVGTLHLLYYFFIFTVLGVVTLGAFALGSFLVSERSREVGIRRALGARRVDILRYFLLENWLVTSLGLGVGLGLSVGLNLLLRQLIHMPPLAGRHVVPGMLLFWLTGLLATLPPALRASRIAPVSATRL